MLFGYTNNMVIRATILGYCMGVRRAVTMALDSRKEYQNHTIYTLGPLIHNKTAIDMLNEKGISVLNPSVLHTLDAKKNPTVIILSAHGTPYSLKQKIEDMGAIVIDATCPRVLVNQKKMHEYANKGFTVFIAGDKSHGEVFALEGSVPSNCDCYVFQNADEAKTFITTKTFDNTKAIVLSQTTIRQNEYNEVCDVLQSAIKDLIILDTICPATLERQNALKDLFEKVEGLIVIGGKNSANTERLYQIAYELSKKQKTEKPVCHIETANEIPSIFFTLKNIGISAGASTPDNVIEDIEKALLKGNFLHE